MSHAPLTAHPESLQDRLSDPDTQQMLHRLLDRAEQLEQILQMTSELPNLLAIATDFFDTIARRAADEGIDLQQRSADVFQLLKEVTEPKNLQAIRALVAQLPRLERGSELAGELPNLLAVAIDVFDEWAIQLKEEGIELESSLRNGLHAALYLGGQIRREEMDRLGFLLKSDVLSEPSVETVGMAGSALSSCRRGTCEQPAPKRMGLLGVLTAMRDPGVQRAVSFAVQFGKCFGNLLEEKHNAPITNNTSSKG